jgi:hypothetical protein
LAAASLLMCMFCVMHLTALATVCDAPSSMG